MRFVLLLCAVLPAVFAAPFQVTARHNSHERSSEIPSRAADIDGATFVLVASSEGCVPSIVHGSVRYPPYEEGVSLALNLSPPEALIPFNDITVNGTTCDREELHEVLALYDPAKIALTDVGVNADDIPHIYVAGVDAASRTCGSTTYAPRVYLYTSQLQHLFRANQRFGGVQIHVTERDAEHQPTAMYMLSIPRNAAQNACLYRRLQQNDNNPAPNLSNEEEPHASAEADEETDDESENDEQSPSETDDPADEAQAVSQPSSPSTFSTAKEQAIFQEELEAQKARESKGRCFPDSATVQLENGQRIAMSQLQIGHRILVAPGVFSPVFMFTHKLSKFVGEFVRIRTDRGDQLSVTGSHYIYLDSQLVPAATAKVGQQVQLEDGSFSTISHVSLVQSSGLFNPQTLHGDIIVDNIRCSTYTEAVNPIVAHSVLAPLRLLFEKFAIHTSQLDNGGDALMNAFRAPLSFLSRA